MNEPEETPAELSAAEEPETNLQAPAPAAALVCPQCSADRSADASYCSDCGFIFSEANETPANELLPPEPIAGRYKLTQFLGERAGVSRFRGEDVSTPDNPFPIVVVRQPAPETVSDTQPSSTEATSFFDFDLPPSGEQATEQMIRPGDLASWPGVAWEQSVLFRTAHLSLPRMIDSFNEGSFIYLIEEYPTGTMLWDAWDRDGVTNRERFTWMIQIAEAIERLHLAGAILEGLRPEMIVISPNGIAILTDLADLLPLPLPEKVPLRGGFSTAPELLLNPAEVDERADLYAFGALLYALALGRELTDLDFTLTGMPRPFLERLPDANPYLARVMAKTFVRSVSQRFPTNEGARTDPTGFRELIAALDACRHNLDRMRLDIAAWSTTGMFRSGNEDGVAVYHLTEVRLDATDELALVLLADGMGGMECGEVATSIALEALRDCLFAGLPLAGMVPSTPVPAAPQSEVPIGELDGEVESPTIESMPVTMEIDRSADAHAERVTAALREANRRIFETARANDASRGMGCTAEVVLVDGNLAIVGHVGDSRVYRMRRGTITQVTRDHTVVGRLVEMGHLTEEEAENHPRRSELHQAVGGRPEVYPDVYAMTLEPGDWIVVCSDGLSNQIPPELIQAVLRDSRNAEKAARRLVNMTLLDGALDNVTVAVIRVA